MENPLHPPRSILPERPHDEGPGGEALPALLPALHGVDDDDHLVEVEEDAEDVARQEHPNDAHEDHGLYLRAGE